VVKSAMSGLRSAITSGVMKSSGNAYERSGTSSKMYTKRPVKPPAISSVVVPRVSHSGVEQASKLRQIFLKSTCVDLFPLVRKEEEFGQPKKEVKHGY